MKMDAIPSVMDISTPKLPESIVGIPCFSILRSVGKSLFRAELLKILNIISKVKIIPEETSDLP